MQGRVTVALRSCHPLTGKIGTIWYHKPGLCRGSTCIQIHKEPHLVANVEKSAYIFGSGIDNGERDWKSFPILLQFFAHNETK